MDHQALTTARQILTVLGIDLDQVRPEPRPLREVLDAYVADLATRATRTHCANVRVGLRWMRDVRDVKPVSNGWPMNSRAPSDRGICNAIPNSIGVQRGGVVFRPPQCLLLVRRRYGVDPHLSGASLILGEEEGGTLRVEPDPLICLVQGVGERRL
jgi:hypothetical protein